ncbi:hypothetical protein WICANDRAFT_82023 [Wickerhamomyces anomalus NRRL Y-366-8]|uniref:Dienelactone hydrolase domain-containing protein n=1 Tax=Wickerhamomyces anomalus (strain ATCC 58044 / CBS 1984 / NCYC 433 / NRRL Y-366-8) TaxID=683960 RepID=A0A1E3P8W2_WICAA|nr:uncharacterized protein WICANDRAFT_82023 [Wickerhamomyces anomalus NRRL Y-366-8]ODQ61841.1 hypothetical protein WICANDRAFT_82023 [Wickerhamomyces anomalus NRRL Y-366-8]
MSVNLTHHCTETNFHSGESVGKIQPEYLTFKDVYVVGDESKNKGVVVILTDIFGNKYNNNQLVADAFAKAGYYALIPDLFDGDAVELENYGKPGYFDTWKKNHGFNVTSPYVKDFLKKIDSELKPTKIFSVGHCYGGKLVIQNLTKDGLLAAGAVAHTSGTELSEVKEIINPIIFSCAENDPAFTDELRTQSQQILKENKIKYQFDLFSGVAHGYAVRGDPNNPDDKYASEKTLKDQIAWFDRFSS